MDLREAISFEATSPTPRFGPKGLSPARLALFGSIGVVLLVLAFQGCASVVAWVGKDPYHQLDFRAIELVQPPPRWFNGTTEQFLDGVRGRSTLPERLSMLDVSLSDLDQAFLRSPWVESVERIERVFPNRLLVTLHYREPVAGVSLTGSSPTILLDRAGDVLPDEVDRSTCPAVLEIQGLPGRLDSRAGLPLRVGGSDVAPARIDPIVASATRLADFLKRQGATDRSAKPPRDIVVLRVKMESGRLYLFSQSGFWISWGEPADPFDESRALARWNRIVDWFHRHPTVTVRHPDYLKFDGDDLILSNDRADSARRSSVRDRIR